MKTLIPTSCRPAEALVVEHDPGTREQLVRALTRSGFGVRTCETLAEGRVHFAQQAVVITHANGDTAELQGFVNFVRQASGTSQPYILAVGEADSPSGISQNSLGLDAFFPVPLAQGPLADQLQDVAQRLTHNQTTTPNGAAVVPAAAAATPAPTATAAAPRSAPVPAMLGHFAPVLLDHLPQALAMFDTDMRYVAANRPFTAAFGLDNREILGRSHYELFPDFHANWRVLFDRALQGEPGRIEEDFFQRADGTSDWVRWEVRPWHESDGTIGGLILSQEIITAQKREERRRTFDRNLTSSLFESQSLPVLLVGLDGRILRSSAAARASLGLQPTADGRLPFWEVYPDRAAEEIEKSRFASLTPLNSATPLGDYSPADILIPGTPTQRLHWSPSPHRNAAGLTQAVLLTGSLTPEPAATTAQNNTPSAAANNAPAPAPTLALANDLTRHVPFGLVLLDREGIVIAANDAVGLLLGRALTAGASFEPWLTESSPEEALRDPVVREWRDTVWRRQMNRTFSLISADGLIKEIELRPRLLPDGHLLLILTDVTESRRAEDALRTSEAKYRGLFREFPTGIVLADRTGALVEGNPALEKLSGYSRVELRRLRLSHLVEMAPEQESVGTDGRAAFLLTRNGSRLPISLSHGPIRNPAGDTLLQACFLLPRTVAAAAAPAVAAAPETAPEEPDTIETSEAPEPLGLHSDTAAWRDLAFANLKTATLVTDLRGRIRAANPAAIRFLATDGDSLEGVALYRLFRPEDPAGFSREVSEQLNARRRWERETVYYDAEGMPVGRCRAEIIPATSDAVPGLLCVIQPVFTMIAASV
jgi:PAS domain S-box-containing protein